MCISTAYLDSVKEENILMNNVVAVSCEKGSVTLTDILERKMTVKGSLSLAHLTDAYLVIQKEE